MNQDVILKEKQYTSGVYAKRDLVLVRGEGALLYDEKGREYIDCVGGQGTANIGHAHPGIVKAICEQATKLVVCPEMFYNDQRADLSARLVELVPGMNRVYLCNSGTEAVEAALKFARLSTGRSQIVASMRGFHGRTFGALSATWNKKYREPFEPLVPDFTHVPFNDLAKLEKAVSQNSAAVILEVVQGEGGVYPASRAYLHAARQICDGQGALLIIDEVQTGFGRTGKFFAFEHHEIKPDLLCVAKSMAGGVPMGATLIAPGVSNITPGMHGSTFGGNPLACAASLATLEIIEKENLVQRAAENGHYLLDQLNRLRLPMIRDIRGLGLMVGIEIRLKVAPYLQALMEHGVLALPAGLTVIRLLPPLVISKDQINRVISVLTEVLSHEPQGS